jgi:flagellar motor switch protein FliG
MDTNQSGAEMSGRRKAATLLVRLGLEVAAEVFKHLSEEEIEQLTVEIATVRSVDSKAATQVLEEFYTAAVAQEYVSQGGVKVAREILEKSLGSTRAMDILSRLQGALQVTPFEFLRRVDPQHLLNFIQHEHPQTIALILAHLQSDHAAQILSSLPAELQTEVAMRLATMDRTIPEVIGDVERVLEQKIASVLSQEFSTAGGVEALAEVINRVDRQTEKLILETLDEENPELAAEIKKLMFVFEDIILLDDRSVQQVLKEIEQKELSLALKGASDEVKEKIFANMSQRAADMIKEDMEYMGPVRVRNVEEAQQRIVAIIRRLEELGEIEILRAGEEELVV